MAEIRISSNLKKYFFWKEVKMWVICISTGIVLGLDGIELINKYIA